MSVSARSGLGKSISRFVRFLGGRGSGEGVDSALVFLGESVDEFAKALAGFTFQGDGVCEQAVMEGIASGDSLTRRAGGALRFFAVGARSDSTFESAHACPA